MTKAPNPRWTPAIIVAGLFLLAAPLARADVLVMDQVAPGVYVHHGVHQEIAPGNSGGIANVGFVVGDQAVAVIDTGGSAAFGSRLRDAVRQVTDLPIRYVINTHVHPDHIFGNAAFKADGADFVGHAKLPRAMAARGAHYMKSLTDTLGDAAAGTTVVPPTVTVDGTMEIDLGDRVLRLVAHPVAHTDNDLTVYDVTTGTLWLGDLLFMDRVPVVDGSLKGWLAVMTDLRGTEAARVVPGHGPVSASWPAALDAQERYLRILLKEIRAEIARGGTMENAVERVGRSERHSWRLFDLYNPRNVVTGFTQLEWE